MKIDFTRNGEKHYKYWKVTHPEVLIKIHQLLESIAQSPFAGLGKPEPLKYELKGFWSRRINGEHRLIYKIEGTKGVDQKCLVIQCRFHY